jgi:hypothetical protein
MPWKLRIDPKGPLAHPKPTQAPRAPKSSTSTERAKAAKTTQAAGTSWL